MDVGEMDVGAGAVGRVIGEEWQAQVQLGMVVTGAGEISPGNVGVWSDDRFGGGLGADDAGGGAVGRSSRPWRRAARKEAVLARASRRARWAR
jgi:hypothetical protein